MNAPAITKTCPELTELEALREMYKAVRVHLDFPASSSFALRVTAAMVERAREAGR